MATEKASKWLSLHNPEECVLLVTRPLWKTGWQFPNKLNLQFPYNPTVGKLEKYHYMKTSYAIAPLLRTCKRIKTFPISSYEYVNKNLPGRLWSGLLGERVKGRRDGSVGNQAWDPKPCKSSCSSIVLCNSSTVTVGEWDGGTGESPANSHDS